MQRMTGQLMAMAPGGGSLSATKAKPKDRKKKK